MIELKVAIKNFLDMPELPSTESFDDSDETLTLALAYATNIKNMQIIYDII